MPEQNLRWVIDRYVCRVCKSNLKYHRDESGAWSIVCAAEPGHQGVWRKSYVESREHQEQAEYIEVITDPAIRAAWPDMPQLEQVGVETAIEELYGERG